MRDVQSIGIMYDLKESSLYEEIGVRTRRSTDKYVLTGMFGSLCKITLSKTMQHFKHEVYQHLLK